MSTPPAPPAWHSELLTVGVTGTNGKTSTTRWVGAILGAVARPVAMATTLGSFLDEDPLEVEKTWGGFLATMRAAVDRGGRFASIELTSEALARGYAKSWPCRVGVFTNLTHDHLDAHGTLEHYLASKAQLFLHLPDGGTAVLNGADPSSDLVAEVTPRGVRVLRFAVPSRGEATAPIDLRATRVDTSWGGTTIALEARGSIGAWPAEISIRAIGDVYAENALAALLAGVAAGVPIDLAVAAMAAAPPPPGRFQVVSERPYVVVDYAHTPDALGRTLAIARRLCTGRLTVVFGAGGDRDRKKREPMGEVAGMADTIVLTSDNPRSEDAGAIAGAIKRGIADLSKVTFEIDRSKAIALAIENAGDDDVVLIAGKGHESGQTIGPVTRPFDDVAASRDALARRRKR